MNADVPKPLYIFDLDGTLADIRHRRHFVERPECPHCGWKKTCGHDHIEAGRKRPPFKPDWDRFYAACVHDTVNVPVAATMIGLLNAGAEVWVWSGRSDQVGAQTLYWLSSMIGLDLKSGQLRMRRADDYTPDDKLKASWLQEMKPQDRQRLVAVFDDRDKVVAMWRAAGVACFQVAPGDF